MLMPNKNRVMIYELLFKEGVMVAEKNLNLPKHPHLDVPNLHVVKALQSLKSRGFVKEQFAWRHYYWYLTNEGITYLRDFLHLPAEIVPSTLKRQTKVESSRISRPSAPRDGAKADGDRQSYRRQTFDKKGDVGLGGGEGIEFVSFSIAHIVMVPTNDTPLLLQKGGYGRGKPAPQ
ncbi:unnamed protein product [Notodromas monacha]|uniref:Plectin/eS10 N-terminal domain-containing protein n=1 Tax=Notodromas monacha TaxID=399045 RepID=A0A7R9BDN0_9CRUS|nr:unnamed protein product [Notodromas monacha]CAG0913465.1 unnamed protein product [Notodromas monacha]